MTQGTSFTNPSQFMWGACATLFGSGLFAGGMILTCCTKNRVAGIVIANIGAGMAFVGNYFAHSDQSEAGLADKAQIGILLGQCHKAVQPYAMSAANWASNNLPEVVSKSSIYNATVGFFNATI